MKKLLLICLLCCGCAEEPPADRELRIAREANALKYSQQHVVRVFYPVVEPDSHGTWKLIEFDYNGRKHVLLQHYDGNNQSMVEISNEEIGVVDGIKP